jgi:hypothetical protein
VAMAGRTALAGCLVAVEAAEEFFSGLDVVEGELAGLGELGDEGLGATAEEGEEFVEEAALGGLAGNKGRKDVEVADLFDAAERAFFLEAVHDCLNRGVGGTPGFGDGLLDFTDRGLAGGPESLHDGEFGLGELHRFSRSSGGFAGFPTSSVVAATIPIDE